MMGKPYVLFLIRTDPDGPQGRWLHFQDEYDTLEEGTEAGIELPAGVSWLCAKVKSMDRTEIWGN